MEQPTADVGHQMAYVARTTQRLVWFNRSDRTSLRSPKYMHVHRSQRTGLLAARRNRLVVCVHDDAHLVHQLDLVLVVAVEFSAHSSRAGAAELSIDIREQRRNVCRRDGLRYTGCSRHGDDR